MTASYHIIKAVISAEIERNRHEELLKEWRCLWIRTLMFWITLGLTTGTLLTRALERLSAFP